MKDLNCNQRLQLFCMIAVTWVVALAFPETADAQVAVRVLNMVTGEVQGLVQHPIWNWLAAGAFLISLVMAVARPGIASILSLVGTGIVCTFLVQRNDLLASIGISAGASGP